MRHQDPIRLYCHVCGTLLDMVRINRSINAGTVRPCAECSPTAHAKSVNLSLDSTDRTARVNALKATKTVRKA